MPSALHGTLSSGDGGEIGRASGEAVSDHVTLRECAASKIFQANANKSHDEKVQSVGSAAFSSRIDRRRSLEQQNDTWIRDQAAAACLVQRKTTAIALQTERKTECESLCPEAIALTTFVDAFLSSPFLSPPRQPFRHRRTQASQSFRT